MNKLRELDIDTFFESELDFDDIVYYVIYNKNGYYASVVVDATSPDNVIRVASQYHEEDGLSPDVHQLLVQTIAKHINFVLAFDNIDKEVKIDIQRRC